MVATSATPNVVLELTEREVQALEYALTEGISNAEYDSKDLIVAYLEDIQTKLQEAQK
jgi:hypothetical protein